MIQIERYLFRTAATASVSGLVVLTGVVWVTQALRQIDLITSKGQTILIFLMMTGLALPSLVAIIAPVALFAGILYTLNKLNGDSELVVMAASGVSPLRLLRPMALLSGLVFAVVAALYIQVLPWSFGAIETLTTFVHADFIANFARPGAFSQLENGFVFHFRDRTPDGALARRLHAGHAGSIQSHDLYRRGGKNSRSRWDELPSVVQRRPLAATIGWRFGDGDLRRLHDRPIAIHARSTARSRGRANVRPRN